jgi:hypothetical protein
MLCALCALSIEAKIREKEITLLPHLAHYILEEKA